MSGSIEQQIESAVKDLKWEHKMRLTFPGAEHEPFECLFDGWDNGFLKIKDPTDHRCDSGFFPDELVRIEVYDYKRNTYIPIYKKPTHT